MKSFISFTACLLFFLNGSSQNEDSLMIKRISDEILTNGKAYDNLRVLTKKIGGRLAGSPQMKMAEQWGEKLMKESGADKVNMQQCRVPHWVRGGQDVARVVKTNRKLDVVALGNSMGSGTKGVSAPVLLVNSFEELEKKER